VSNVKNMKKKNQDFEIFGSLGNIIMNYEIYSLIYGKYSWNYKTNSVGIKRYKVIIMNDDTKITYDKLMRYKGIIMRNKGGLMRCKVIILKLWDRVNYE